MSERGCRESVVPSKVATTKLNLETKDKHHIKCGLIHFGKISVLETVLFKGAGHPEPFASSEASGLS